MPTTQTPYRKKLIEVDLPLDAINKESAKDAQLTHGHPSTLQKWWARRPLATCRAIIFASLVDDPSGCPDEFPDEPSQRAERDRLHGLISRLVVWKNSNEEGLLTQARYEIARSVARTIGKTAPTDPVGVLEFLNENAPHVHDPFAGGGSIPLEAQRLGLRPSASDLNPIAVLINKALVELPVSFNGKPPANPEADPLGMLTGKQVGRGKTKKPEKIPWRGASGLASDVRFYGNKMREAAVKRIGRFFPSVKLANGGEATVIAWIWARTVPCPNPACQVLMPLMASFKLSRNAPTNYSVDPIVDRNDGTVSFRVYRDDDSTEGSGTVNRKGAICISCRQPVKLDYVRQQARIGNLGKQMVASISKNENQRFYTSPSQDHLHAARSVDVPWRPQTVLPRRATKAISLQSYGMRKWHEVFTERQLLALATFSDLVAEIREVIVEDCGEKDYADAVCTYLAFAVSRLADAANTFAVWEGSRNFIAAAFSRQGLGMVWDFPEANPFSDSTQNWTSQVNWVAKVIEKLPTMVNRGWIAQIDAADDTSNQQSPVVITDPPYYDSIYYSDTSDFFYAWLRPMLRNVYPELFAGMLTPKDEEIIVNRSRFPDAHNRFEKLLKDSLSVIHNDCTNQYPSSVFYAYKQVEKESDGRTSTAWESFLWALITVGFRVVRTWPMRTENTRSLKSNRNQLASSIVLVCRPREENAGSVTRQQFIDEIELLMPAALDQLTLQGHIAPADLPQAAIGPGMEIYSKYSRVETISGEPVTVREALQQINRVIGAYFDKEEGELDSASRFCVDWLKTHGYKIARYGDAENIARAKNLSVSDIANIHNLIQAERGDVQLHPISQYVPDRKYPMTDLTAWEGCMRMAFHLETSNEDGLGIPGCGEVGRRMTGNLDSIERLARILYNHYDNLNQPRNAYIYNQLVSEWQNILDEVQRPERPTLV